jgi:hypothetical protein
MNHDCVLVSRSTLFLASKFVSLSDMNLPVPRF